MKKIILSSLFSAVLVFGGGSITAFADDLGPTDPATPPITEPTDSSEPTNPTEPVDPAEPPVIPTDPTEPSKPTEPTTPSEPEKPVTPEQPKEPTQPVIPEKPAEPETPKTPEQPTKPIDVVVTPSGEIDKTNQSAGTQPSIPIETSNLAEVTHVPSETTPITTEAGEEIVAVDKGVPLTKTPEGLKPISSSYKVLPSGNVEVKASDGKMKVLPHTGEKFTLLFSVLGSFFVLISGFFFFKKNKKKA
ncbi:TPA: LPXTG cell wall anchor domain-containing protein [Enterococcus faecalis]|uniref:LPXTG cell wall anchor domain-containing protein n=1 Tax=Enterococcus faecalis TaxID=1351 RepID=UPI00177DE0A7|nr:LPXTG cell wall anchor domain-containing protein [Enterococcus faecalis]EGO2665440.1 LPXTG cell wall anchor domain-containing protein [Enterococcus faecalis]MBD9808783.1 LPXTG cell wall anchor domain-containing protein [Enterococcus faecalis]MBJ1687852.1 LPXTG cell wall anchor domain-containing protein [Enterococcus faecalis]MDF4233642.1 LPXTG cell wall anchor domain-containing protein [Enterococcus faecalis]HBI1674798.1 LPXTG cell wall anchor domain-containing protein [Enterococcus faecali